MKKIVITLSLLLIVLTLTACKAGDNSTESQGGESSSKSQSQSENITQIPNPFSDHENIEQAMDAVGFNISVPENIEETYKTDKYRTMLTTMIEVVYTNGTDKITIRKSSDKGDISGDFNNYSQEETIEINSMAVTVKGNNDKINLATWNTEEYSFSIGLTAGIDEKTLEGIILEIE